MARRSPGKAPTMIPNRSFAFAVVAGLAMAGPAFAADGHHEAKANSSATVDIKSDGTVVMHSRNAELIPYGVYNGERYLPRLATVTTDVTKRTDAEGDDPSSTVSVIVDDLSGETPNRLSSFSDPGSEGEILGETYFDISQPGCCAGPTIHSIRSLEDGKLLFRATGDSEAGSSAWAEAPNSKPRLIRWAAFDGVVDEAAANAGVVGYLSYGDLNGTMSRLEIKTADNKDDMNTGLSHEAKLVWVDAKSQKSGHEPASGSPENPESIWSLDKISDPGKMGGFSLRLLNYDGHTLATVPVEADRLVAGQAKLGKGIPVSELPK